MRTLTIPNFAAAVTGQGGTLGPLMRAEPGSGQEDYFIIVPTDPASAIAKIAYGGEGKITKGADSEWDGLANTRALATSKNKHPAARAAAELVIDGHQDFYLPAKRESRVLQAMFPELFDPVAQWTSTQYSADYAWYQYFNRGNQHNLVKSWELGVKFVRRLPLSFFSTSVL
ncbi:MAG: hypothetical protein KF740_19865 [Ramlibacter sp.]|nr:hypothetical protein [Ramlibacter sp.]